MWHQHRRYQVWIYIDSELTSLGDTTATTIHSLWQSLYLVSPPGDVHQRHTRYFSYTPSEIPITLHHTEAGRISGWPKRVDSEGPTVATI
jgi:hypothetical protein